jgi:hypothetical protein
MSRKPIGEGKGWRQKVDYKEAEQMLRAGKTQQEVAEHFGVSQSAVSLGIKRANIKADTNRAEGRAVPWHPIAIQWRDQYLARMLRAAHRRNQGIKSSAFTEAQLDTFLRAMTEQGFVIDYDDETGFHKVPRRLGVDFGMVKEPMLDDRGRKRKKLA